MNVSRFENMKIPIESDLKKVLEGVYLLCEICFNTPTLNKLFKHTNLNPINSVFAHGLRLNLCTFLSLNKRYRSNHETGS